MITRPRTIFAGLLLLGVALGPRCATTGTPHPDPLPAGGEREKTGPLPAHGERQSSDPFHSAVRPILSTRCAPCHEPGGKMYAKLPFDDAQTVSTNSTAILRRLKGDDRAALEKWVEGLAAATPAR